MCRGNFGKVNMSVLKLIVKKSEKNIYLLCMSEPFLLACLHSI